MEGRGLQRAGSRTTALAVLIAGLARLVGAQFSPAGPDFQVNTLATGRQWYASVGADTEGNFVVVWESEGSDGTDSSSASVQARRFRADGLPLGPQFQVNTFTTGEQWEPEVAVDGQCGFVVVWESEGSGDTDTSGWSVHARRYGADGQALGDEFQVNTYTTNDQRFPAVAADALGNFLVAWQSHGSSGPDSTDWSIQARRFGADGSPLGSEFQVNTYTTNFQRLPSIDVNSQGLFVIGWQSSGSNGGDTSSRSIQARRFSANGAPLDAQFQVNTFTTGDQMAPAVAIDDQGHLVVAWQSLGSFESDTDAWSIQARRFDASGSPVGPERQINTYTTSYQLKPTVATEGGGRFLVAWQSYGSGGGDVSGYSVQARRLDAAGSPFGDEFQLNSSTMDDQARPALAADDPGNFVVVWQSESSSGPDADGYSVQARRFDALFRDGFETGGTARWTATTG
ncbi:MAG: hypothetical protein K8I65_14150 [Thermoanaerobaculia bacterium]|nr:hypothetical protein [Thermoanaerobaculia bacterium]